MFGNDCSNDAIKICMIDSVYHEAHEDLPSDANGSDGIGGGWSQDPCKDGIYIDGTMLVKNSNVGGVEF